MSNGMTFMGEQGKEKGIKTRLTTVTDILIGECKRKDSLKVLTVISGSRVF